MKGFGHKLRFKYLGKIEMKRIIVRLGITAFSFGAIAFALSTDAGANEQLNLSNNSLFVKNTPQRAQATLQPGVYNAGSRYINIVQKGKRFCYEGVSIPHGRYAVAVGETIGSLSQTSNGFIIDGLKKRGKHILLRTNNNKLLISDAKNTQRGDMEYDLNEIEISNSEISTELKQCLNSKGAFLIPVPGSGYKLK
jgi:hypothetical protein